jgi:hypothetical protein
MPGKPRYLAKREKQEEALLKYTEQMPLGQDILRFHAQAGWVSPYLDGGGR